MSVQRCKSAKNNFIAIGFRVCVYVCVYVWHIILFLSFLDVNKKGACLWSPSVVFAVLFITIVAVCGVFIAWKASALSQTCCQFALMIEETFLS